MCETGLWAGSLGSDIHSLAFGARDPGAAQFGKSEAQGLVKSHPEILTNPVQRRNRM